MFNCFKYVMYMNCPTGFKWLNQHFIAEGYGKEHVPWDGFYAIPVPPGLKLNQKLLLLWIFRF